MKKATAWILAALLALSLSGCGSGAAKPETTELFAMDTLMNLTAYGSGAKKALSDASAEISRLESLLSRTEGSSEVSQLNKNGGNPMKVDPEVAKLIRKSVEYSKATDGAFDITIAPVVSAWGFTTDHYQVPPQSELDALLKNVDFSRITVEGDTVTLGADQSIDLGGIAKGYTSDRIAALFADDGVKSGMISLGGNVYVRGDKPDGSAWHVAVQDPNDSKSYVGILSLKDAFAVTSGGYQRYFTQDGKTYHHIMDPSTGHPAESGLVSVTVVSSDNGTMCDAFSTALFVMGEKKALSFWRTGGYRFDLVLVTSDGRVLITDGIAGRFEETEGSGYHYEVVS
jgi:thiamine biosynthesis lipoprotein